MQSLSVIEFQGNLTSLTGGKLIDAVNQAVKSNPSIVLIDLHLVTFIDSAGLAILVRSYKIAQSVGIHFALCSISSPVKLIFDLVSADAIFEIFPDRQAFYENWSQAFPQDALIPVMDDSSVTRVKAS